MDSDWLKVFDQLEKDKQKLLRQEFTIDGKKMVFEKDEMIFILGEMLCVLSDKGWKFELPDGGIKTNAEAPA